MTIMIRSKALSDAAWKEVLTKNKGVKDNGMLKALADIKKLGDDDHDDAQKILDEIVKLSGQLKKSKEIAATPAVSKFLAELSGAADTALRDVAKAKAEAQKTSKAQAEAKKREEEAGKKDEDDDEDDESSELLTTKMLPLLRQVNKGEMMHVLIARAGKQVAVMMSRKPIAPARRKILADELGVSGGVKYFGGHCVKEDGATTFVLKSEVTGLAKLLKLALLNQTGMRVKKLACRGEDGEDTDHDEDEGDELQAGGPEGGDTPEPTRAKEPSPELVQAPQAWDGARELLADQHRRAEGGGSRAARRPGRRFRRRDRRSPRETRPDPRPSRSPIDDFARQRRGHPGRRRTHFGASGVEGSPRRVHPVRPVRTLDRPRRQEPLRRQDRAEGDVVEEPHAVGTGPRLKSQ